MQRRKDDLTFEGAWKNQVKEEAKEVAPAEKKEVKVHEAPAFRGQRDVVENRAQIRMPTKQQPAPEKKASGSCFRGIVKRRRRFRCRVVNTTWST